jgi:SAM-dependent methyltransferase
VGVGVNVFQPLNLADRIVGGKYTPAYVSELCNWGVMPRIEARGLSTAQSLLMELVLVNILMRFGATYQEQAKSLRRWYIEQYRLFNDDFGRTNNAYFRDALIKNYIYKGPVLEWYMRIKCRIDGYYDLWDRLIPRKATITDIGCGYGQMSYMLGLLSPDREVLGVDYDEDKIEVAKHAFLSKKCNVRFLCADMREVDIPLSDAILFNDSLHYVDAEAQQEILKRAASRLNSGGMLIVRDGDAGQADKHEKIKTTELWSTRIIKFNKTTAELTFVSESWMREFAQQNSLDIKIRRCDRDSSETLYILTRMN